MSNVQYIPAKDQWKNRLTEYFLYAAKQSNVPSMPSITSTCLTERVRHSTLDIRHSSKLHFFRRGNAEQIQTAPQNQTNGAQKRKTGATDRNVSLQDRHLLIKFGERFGKIVAVTRHNGRIAFVRRRRNDVGEFGKPHDQLPLGRSS